MVDLLADVRLTSGPVVWVAWLLGAAGALYLLRGRPAVPVHRRMVHAFSAAAAGLVLVISSHWLLINVFSILPEDVPDPVLMWLVPAVTAILLLTLFMRHASWNTGLSAVVAVLLVIALSAVQINAYFGLNRSVSDLLGTSVSDIPPLETALMRQPGAKPAPALDGWQAQGSLPDGGKLRTANIPGTASGMASRDAYIYLPPAYFAENRPALPVLLLIAGQPGGPADWLTGGALRGHLDSFAASHGGLAPVVVVADPNGSQTGNTMCMDSRIAKADTYLSVDVAEWINATLAVDTDHRQWAAGGFSFGATCAVQLGTRHPGLYSSVLAFSSEAEPAISKERQKTIEAAFPGDPAAFDRQTPLAIMATSRFEGSGMYLTAGQDDPEFVDYLRTLAAAARSSGFDVRDHIVAHTGHSWDTSSKRFTDALEFLAARWGLTA